MKFLLFQNEPMKFFFRITDINLVSERFDRFEPSLLDEDEEIFKPHSRTPGKKHIKKDNKTDPQPRLADSAKVSSELTSAETNCDKINSSEKHPDETIPNGVGSSPTNEPKINCTQELTIKTNFPNAIGPNPKTNSTLATLQQQKSAIPALLKASPRSKDETAAKPFETILKTESKNDCFAMTLQSIQETIKNFPRSDTPPMFMDNRLNPIDPVPITEVAQNGQPVKPEAVKASPKAVTNDAKKDLVSPKLAKNLASPKLAKSEIGSPKVAKSEIASPKAAKNDACQKPVTKDMPKSRTEVKNDVGCKKPESDMPKLKAEAIDLGCKPVANDMPKLKIEVKNDLGSPKSVGSKGEAVNAKPVQEEDPKVKVSVSAPKPTENDVDGEKQQFLKSIQLTAKTILPIVTKAADPTEEQRAETTKRKAVRKEKPVKRLKLTLPKPQAILPKTPQTATKSEVNQVVRQIMTNVKQQVTSVSKIVEQSDKIPQNNQLLSLFDNCKINIPSSLSITLTESKNDDYESKPAPIKPVQNYIEILKLPDPPQGEKKEDKTEDKKTEDKKLESRKQTFQTMFEEAVKKNESMKKVFKYESVAKQPSAPSLKPKKNQSNALDLSKTSPKEGHKRAMSVEQIAQHLSKRSRMEAESPKVPKSPATENDGKKINIVNNNITSGGSISIQDSAIKSPRLPVAKAPTLKLGPSLPRVLPKPIAKPVLKSPKVESMPAIPNLALNPNQIIEMYNIASLQHLTQANISQAQIAFQPMMQALMMSHQLEMQQYQATQRIRDFKKHHPIAKTNFKRF